MKWITRERPKIDRLACPWLIRRFIDPKAQIIYVPENEVLTQAAALNATPFDIPGVEFTHYDDQCTFDYFIKKYELKDPALQVMAPVVRGADTDDHALARQSSGLWAISAGLAHNTQDDQELLEKGMLIYDALYSWATHLREEKHTQSPTEHLLLQIYKTYISNKNEKKSKVPAWTKDLKNLIQDHIDTNLNFNLKIASEELDVNPAYLSREFSRYFDNLSFGEYIRKLRIEKSIQLLESSEDSLAEIAYLTGFSDQSHFNRVFKAHMGQTPSEYRKFIRKSKGNTKR
ncbi:chromate resistance protein ChrB domain-containing protein [Dyadobacter fermentans]|uniref:Transcriptional regulator, AraC family n=1 Tax=Dyadobacter fermentans (strain ATCC 700827 / DSM 18053 / CIP 107007 / KCTC 52180 / NS114) TaxID=471854 RepID=C6VXC6_DYAFD|nr:chromate resistance protein ChrB domain-containing protein [Dyadobacter fermentans]ACT93269.1 transcriptional regulator, AraC family [Dyadobacter fermentans DSM 18053]